MRLATHFGVVGRDIGRTIDYCHAFGIEHLSSGYQPAEGLIALKEQLAKEGIILAVVEVGGWLRGEPVPQKSELRDLADKLKAIGDASIEMAHMFFIVGSSGDQHLDDEWKSVIDLYEELGRHAEENKVKVAIHPGYNPNHIIKDRATFKKLLDAVPNQYIGVNMCYGCFYSSGPAGKADIQEGIDETVATFGDRLFMIHARDGEYYEGGRGEMAMGLGNMDLAAIIDSVYRSGVDPILIPEHMPKVLDEQNSEISAAWALGYLSGMMKRKK